MIRREDKAWHCTDHLPIIPYLSTVSIFPKILPTYILRHLGEGETINPFHSLTTFHSYALSWKTLSFAFKQVLKLFLFYSCNAIQCSEIPHKVQQYSPTGPHTPAKTSVVDGRSVGTLAIDDEAGFPLITEMKVHASHSALIR